MDVTVEERLRAAIAAAPDDAEPFLVYADFLQQRGDPVGELIMVMCERERSAADDALRQRERALLAACAPSLLGELAWYDDRVTIGWRRGFIHSAAFHYGRRLNGGPPLVALLAEARAGRLVERLTIGAETYHQEEGLSSEIAALDVAALPRLAHLRFASTTTARARPPLEHARPAAWPMPRRPLTLDFAAYVPRVLPAIAAEADAITLRGEGDGVLSRALSLLAQRRSGAPVCLALIEPTAQAIGRLAARALPLTGLALVDLQPAVHDAVVAKAATLAPPPLGIAIVRSSDATSS